MTGKANESTDYASEVAQMLWPPPWGEPEFTRGARGPAAEERDAYLFPSRRRPRLLVPVDVPSSASMVHRLGRGRASLDVPLRGLLERAVRSRAFAMTRWPVLRVSSGDPGADSIESYLSQALGVSVRVGVLLGTRRPNQKPVLAIFDRDSHEVVGYAKIGHNELTAGLVRREARALAAVGAARPSSFQAPRLLHSGTWGRLEVVVMSALHTDPRKLVSTAQRLAAMTEVASLRGTQAEPLDQSEYWSSLRSTTGEVVDAGARGRLVAAAAAIEARHGRDVLMFGSWHGDWGGWNMGVDASGRVQLWDWERFGSGVPVGFDAVHFAVQRLRPGKRDAARREEQLTRSMSSTLEVHGVHAAAAGLTLRLYLLDMAVRYQDSWCHAQTPALQRRAGWVTDFLERLIALPTHSSQEEA